MLIFGRLDGCYHKSMEAMSLYKLKNLNVVGELGGDTSIDDSTQQPHQARAEDITLPDPYDPYQATMDAYAVERFEDEIYDESPLLFLSQDNTIETNQEAQLNQPEDDTINNRQFDGGLTSGLDADTEPTTIVLALEGNSTTPVFEIGSGSAHQADTTLDDLVDSYQGEMNDYPTERSDMERNEDILPLIPLQDNTTETQISQPQDNALENRQFDGGLTSGLDEHREPPTDVLFENVQNTDINLQNIDINLQSQIDVPGLMLQSFTDNSEGNTMSEQQQQKNNSGLGTVGENPADAKMEHEPNVIIDEVGEEPSLTPEMGNAHPVRFVTKSLKS